MKSLATKCCMTLAMLATSSLASAQIIPWGYNPYGMQQANRAYGRHYVAPRVRYYNHGRHYGGYYGHTSIHQYEVENQLRRQADALEWIEFDNRLRNMRLQWP